MAWPKKGSGDRWIDSAGTHFDQKTHAWNKTDKQPSVKKDGTFRNKPKTKKAAKPAQNDEQRVVEANQILAVMQTHVSNATTPERLDELRRQTDLMGFTQGEIDIAVRWIDARRQELEE